MAGLPHLRKNGDVTQLIVDGKPFLALAGELHNSSASSLEHMRPIWPRLAQMRLNTVLAPVSWQQIEPAEGRFDFAVVDGLIRDARRSGLRLVLLWFGSWKNSNSTYPPDWVKADQERFPHVRNQEGNTLEILSTLGRESREADARAFAALMRRVREVDSEAHTVLMVQVENEVGVLGESRDRSDAAEDAYGQPVPQELIDYLTQRRDALLPELREIWESAGSKSSGAWQAIFGGAADEIFMAWNYARYINGVAEAGKAEHALPMFVNAWIVQPSDRGPGDYPGGGPVAHLHDIWRAGAPAIDLLTPDIYLPDFPDILARYSRSGNPVFVPESRAGDDGAANAFYAIGQHAAIGYSPFGIDGWEMSVENGPISRAYAVLAQLAPRILEHQANNSIAGAWLTRQNPTQKAELGDYTLEFDLRRSLHAPDELPERGYGLALAIGQDEYVVAGADMQVTFSPRTPGPPIAGLLSVEEGVFADGRWVAGRRLNGDETQLRYDFSVAARSSQSGTGLRFPADGPTIQRVRLYRYG